MLGQTPSQTIGPFFSHALTAPSRDYRPPLGWVLAEDPVPGALIRVRGKLLDGTGKPVSDGMVELWQAGSEGEFRCDGKFRGYGRCGTDGSGLFRFQTVKPGSTGPGLAPHLHLAVFARGMLNHAFTRAYFSDEPAANAGDPVLSSVAADRRPTLIARRRGGEATYDFDIVLQGDGETVFFDA